MAQTTIHLVDDEDTLRNNLAQVLEEEGFAVTACRDGAEGLRALRATPPDVLMTDLRMPGVPGMELIDHARKLAPHAIIIVITAFGEVETAVEAMKKGAQDYICKPLIFDEVVFRLKRLLAHDGLARENKQLKEQIRQNRADEKMVFVSPVMTTIHDTITRIAHTMSNVLICGESGTGKEVLARMLHYAGATQDKPFVAVNCGGLTKSLIESEFFGHRRGTFTGANADRVGYFEAADGGTLFLDEIGNLPLSSQAILLRAIEEKAITRVGDTRTRPVSIRIVAATNRDLENAIEKGVFREDLYFRLNVIRLTVPPLRERPEDIPPLAEHFVAKYRKEINSQCPGFSEEALELLCRNSWRGNVRELENMVERAVIFAGDRTIAPKDLTMTGVSTSNAQVAIVNLRRATREFEKHHIAKTLAKLDNNKMAAADALGIGLSSLYRKMEELCITKQSPSPHPQKVSSE